MPRNDDNASVEQLQAAFQGGISDPVKLQNMLRRLSGHKSQRASELRGKIIARLGELHAPIPEVPRASTTNHASMRPPGAPGLPPPILPRVSNRTELNFAPEATQAQKYVAALQAHISELRHSSKGRSRLLTNGRQIPSGGQTLLYSFETEESKGLVDESKVQLEVEQVVHEAVIASVQPDSVLLSTSADLGSELPQARLLMDDTALLSQLSERIAEIGNNFWFNVTLADAVVSSAPRLAEIQPLHDSAFTATLDNSQLRGRERVRIQPLTYIWGPPGCGKTFTLAEIVRMAFVAGQRILICSNTNKAVDQVLYGVCKQLQTGHAAALDAGQVIRLGQIVDEQLRTDFADAIGAEAVSKRLAQELDARIAEKQTQRQHTTAQLRTTREWVACFNELDRKRRGAADSWRELASLITRCQQAETKIKVEQRSRAQLHTELSRAQGFIGWLLHRSKQAIWADIQRTDEDIRKCESDIAKAHQHHHAASLRHQEHQTEYYQLEAELAHIDESKQRRELKRLEQALLDEIQALEKQVAQLHAEVIRNARIIGATGTRAYLSVRDISPVDIVIIDEASMMLLPVVWFIAGIASTRVVICGDFRQLPPILSTKDSAIQELIGTDVFDTAGVTQLNSADGRIVMLNTQRRMQPAICGLISGPMYGGRLRTLDDMDFWAVRNSQPKPQPWSATLTIVDTSDLHPVEAVDRTGSRFNLLHALLTRNIARHLQQSGYLQDTTRLAIITPYRAQVNLTRTLLADAEVEHAQVGTVHAFQGDERHTIVFDIPESDGARSQPGQLIRGPAPNDTGARLINVAVSRAQSHLIVVANLSYLDRTLPTTSMLRGVLHDMQAHGAVIQARNVLALGPAYMEGLDGVDIKALARDYGLFDQTDFDGALAVDIGRARHSIAIFSGFIGTKRTDELTELLGARIQAGVPIRCVTRPPHSNLPDRRVGKKALNQLEAIGCVVDCRKHIHQKVVIIDGHIVWHGSLNALSYSQYADELMMRTVGPGFARIVASLLAKGRVQFEEALEVITKAENPRCGSCKTSVRTYLDRVDDVEQFRCEDFCGWRRPLGGAPRRKMPQPENVDTSPAASSSHTCPECGGQMIERKGPYGRFLGCSKYPSCKGTLRANTQNPA
ncbi:AAA domain-containing protein [Steroidobacter sp.]|uniref:AAA domain-containing protein n=1 Tax=Steroidobacter sp. TaxID=1978227 RepID=UPI001A549817|nr:AAA domain-containing protein [Steroidobacter sp.]MBL8265506.1 topoisomerase DNA-binding C4 zinc finger domain-containing protein [Steroidobacter sp.]